MKRVLLTGINGTVAQVMKKELGTKYDISGLSIPRMDGLLAEGRSTWKELLDAYRDRVSAELTAACSGVDAVVHLGWNTIDENWQGGLDPLNIAVVDCVYRVAITEQVPRIYMASSVHAYDCMDGDFDPDVAIPPHPDTRRDPFGLGASSLYGVSKRWMEIAGQYYAKRLQPGQKILAVRLGGVGRAERPGAPNRFWDSHRDCAGLLEAFIECGDDAPDYCTVFGISDNRSPEHQEPMFNPVNPYGFRPADNSYNLDYEES
jgi:uronate dehydrogenase